MVRALDNKVYSLEQPLVRMRPADGYDINVKVNGRPMLVQGEHPITVFNGAKQLYAANNIEIEDHQIWFNLNLIWTHRLGERHSVVTNKVLMSMIEEVSEFEAAMAKELSRNITNPGVGSKGWGIVQLYLMVEKDEYDQKVFEVITKVIQRILKTEHVGCPECATNFDNKLKGADLTTRESAREWVWKSMNEVNKDNGKPELTKEIAYIANKWHD